MTQITEEQDPSESHVVLNASFSITLKEDGMELFLTV